MNLRHPLATSHTSGARATRSKGVALAVLATAQLVIALDYSIVNVALPDIGRSLGFTAAFMSSFGMQLFFLTLYFQQVLGEDPLQAGLRFLPLVLSVVVGTQLGGRLVGRLGIARTLAAGMAFGAVGLALYLRLPVTGSLADLLPGTIVAGLGQGVAFTTMYVAAGTSVAADRHLSADDLRRIEVIVADAVPVWGSHPEGM